MLHRKCSSPIFSGYGDVLRYGVAGTAGHRDGCVIDYLTSPGTHKVLIELQDANHHALDKGTVTFVIPEKIAAEKHH